MVLHQRWTRSIPTNKLTKHEQNLFCQQILSQQPFQYSETVFNQLASRQKNWTIHPLQVSPPSFLSRLLLLYRLKISDYRYFNTLQAIRILSQELEAPKKRARTLCVWDKTLPPTHTKRRIEGGGDTQEKKHTHF